MNKSCSCTPLKIAWETCSFLSQPSLSLFRIIIGFSSRIHLSEATRDRLEKAGGYHIEPRGGIDIKGKGKMNTYWLLGKKGFDKELPVPPQIG